MTNCGFILCFLLASILGARSRGVNFEPQVDLRILGGTNAPDGAYPYMISLQINGQHWCGGSIIHPEWVTTAAHCILGDTEFEVVVGTNKWNSGGTHYPVIDIIIHDNYTSLNGEHDVALLKVGPIAFTDKIGFVLLETNYVGGGHPCTLCGWGLTTFPGTIDDLPIDLQHLSFITDTNEHCSSVQLFPVPVSDICALTLKGQGSCFSDSGSPLVWNNDGVIKQIGMVTWMSGPCGDGKPNGYNRMSYYVDWIREKCKNCI